MPTALGHHASFALPLEFLDIVVIEDSKAMQTLFRSMLSSFHPRRVRTFDNFQDALTAMVNEPPTLVITDWRVGRSTAYRFLKLLRARGMRPLCHVAVMIVTAHATQRVVEKAMSAGAHAILAKPVSPSLLQERITRLAADGRRFVLQLDGCYGVEGADERLAEIRSKTETLERARAYQQRLTGLGTGRTARKRTVREPLPPEIALPAAVASPPPPSAAVPPATAVDATTVDAAPPPAPAPKGETAPAAGEDPIFAAPHTATPRVVKGRPPRGWGAVAKRFV